jgi:hypothetical protein
VHGDAMASLDDYELMTFHEFKDVAFMVFAFLVALL